MFVRSPNRGPGYGKHSVGCRMRRIQQQAVAVFLSAATQRPCIRIRANRPCLWSRCRRKSNQNHRSLCATTKTSKSMPRPKPRHLCNDTPHDTVLPPSSNVCARALDIAHSPMQAWAQDTRCWANTCARPASCRRPPMSVSVARVHNTCRWKHAWRMPQQIKAAKEDLGKTLSDGHGLLGAK